MVTEGYFCRHQPGSLALKPVGFYIGLWIFAGNKLHGLQFLHVLFSMMITDHFVTFEA